jgi:hypothetical protein
MAEIQKSTNNQEVKSEFLKLTENFENGQSYTVEVKGIESDNIKFEVK